MVERGWVAVGERRWVAVVEGLSEGVVGWVAGGKGCGWLWWGVGQRGCADVVVWVVPVSELEMSTVGGLEI